MSEPKKRNLSNKVIITCAVTGSIHTPTMSDALPITPEEIGTSAIEAAQAGAAILHLHERDRAPHADFSIIGMRCNHQHVEHRRSPRYGKNDTPGIFPPGSGGSRGWPAFAQPVHRQHTLRP